MGRQETLFPMEMDDVDDRRVDASPSVSAAAPDPEELGRALLAGARLAVNKRLFWGQCPKGLTKDDLVGEIVAMALQRARRYRHGKIRIENYCYVLCCNCLTDYFRARARALRDYENGSRDKDICDADDTISLVDAGLERRSV